VAGEGRLPPTPRPSASWNAPSSRTFDAASAGTDFARGCRPAPAARSSSVAALRGASASRP